MSRRAAAVAETRQRIVDAAFAVHGEQGIAGARLEDIANRAGVSLGTVYRHFPQYEQLVAACGAMTFEQAPPPRADDAEAALAGLDRPARLETLIRRLYAYYEQTGHVVQTLRSDRGRLEPVDEALEEIEAGLRAWIDRAVEGLPEPDRALVAALADHRTWTALTEQGVPDPAGAVLSLLDGG